MLHKKPKLHFSLSFFPTFYIFDEKTILLYTEPIVALSELLLYSSACSPSMLNYKCVKFPLGVECPCMLLSEFFLTLGL